MPPQQRRRATQGQGLFSLVFNLITIPFRLIIGGVTSLFSLFKSKPKSSEQSEPVGSNQPNEPKGLPSDDMGLGGLEEDFPKKTKPVAVQEKGLETENKEASKAPSTGLEGIMDKAPPAQPKEKTLQQAAQGNEKDQMAELMAMMQKEPSPKGSHSSPTRTPAIANPTKGRTM